MHRPIGTGRRFIQESAQEIMGVVKSKVCRFVSTESASHGHPSAEAFPPGGTPDFCFL